MKVTVIIATMMLAQVSASFLEVFQGAVLSVQNSFGKLFSDVVTDVKDTVDCTILAVEHILSLSEDATARYYKECASAKNDTQSNSQLKNNFPVLEISIANNEEYLKKELPEEIDARINATLLKYLNGYNPHDKLEDVQKELAKETERLADVSDLVRQELCKLSKEIHLDFTNVERKGYKPSVDSILDELKVLELIEQNIRNFSVANEIHRLVYDVLNKLYVIESSGAKQNDKVDGILRDLERSSNRSYKDMRQQLEDWKAEEARHLNVIKAKMDEHEKLPKHLEYAKMDNTFAMIERNAKISLVPIEKEIASKTVPLSSKNTMESIPPNIVTNTDSKFLTFITKQNSSTSKIAIQPSLDATSPVQINDASGVITPVSISTSSYVNEINVDVMETLIPQRFKKPIFHPMPDTTFTEKPLHSMNLATRQSTIELLERSTTISAMTSESATSLLVTAIDPTKSSTRILEPITSVLMTSPELTIFAATPEPTRSLAKTAIESTTNAATPLESTKSLTVTVLKPTTRFTMTSEFTTDLLLTAPESTTNLTATPKPSTYSSMTPTERDTNPTMLPEPTRNLTVTTTEPATSSAVSPEPTMDLLVTNPESTKNPGTNPELSTDLQVTVGVGIRNSVVMPKSTKNIPVDLLEMAIDSTINSVMSREPAISLLVTATDPTKSSTTIPEPTTIIPMMAPDLTILATTPEPTTSLAKTAIESTTNAATHLESNNSLTVTALKPTTRFAMTSEFTTDLSLMAPESTASLTATSEPSAYPSMTPIERDTNPTMLPKHTRDLTVTITELATSSAVNPEPTMNLLVINPESTKNPGTNPKLSTDLQVTVGGGIRNSVVMLKSTTNIPVIATVVTTSPTMTQDLNTSLPVTASRLISFATTPEPTTNFPMASTKSTTNLTTTIKLAMHLPLKAPESNLGMISELPTRLPVIASESTSPTKTSKPIPNLLIINSDATTNPTMPSESTTSLPVTTSEITNFVTIPEPIKNYPVTNFEPIISSETIPKLTTKPLGTTTEVTTYHLVKTTGIRTSLHVTNTESTSSRPKIMPKATTSLTATVPEPANSLAPNLSVINRNLSMSAFKHNTSSTITPELTTNLPVSTFQEPISSSQAMSPEPSMTSTVTILEPIPISIMMTLGPTTSSQMKFQEPITKPAKIIRETTTSRSIMTLESTTSSTETMSKPTTGSLGTTLKLVTNNLSNFQHPFNLPTHRPEVPTPSLNAFLNYIDRKEGFIKPIIQSTGMTTTPFATPIGAELKILPLSQNSYSKPLFDIKNGPIKAKLNAFFSHLPAQNISSPYARNDYAVPINRTVPGLPKIAYNMPLPYIMKPSALNKNDHPRHLSFSHLRPQRAHYESPYGGNNNTPTLGKGIPQKRHILPQRQNHQNTPIQSSVRLSTNLSSSLGLITNKPVPMSKANNDDDADYKSLFHLPSNDSEAHSRALKEAKKLIEDSKRAQHVINNIFKNKNKGISAFNFPKSLKIDK